MTTVLFLHGAYHGAWCFDETVKEFPVSTLAFNFTLDESTTLESMAKELSCVIEKINDEIVIVGHSFAGMVLSELKIEQIPKIKHIILVSAVITENGKSFIELLPIETKTYIESQEKMIPVRRESVINRFANMLPKDKLDRYLNQLRAQPIKPYKDCLTNTGISNFANKITYIWCKQDRSISEIMKNEIIKNLPKQTRHIELDSDHIPMLSVPEEFKRLIIELLGLSKE